MTDFATALAEYAALLDQVETALKDGNWEGFAELPAELPAIEGELSAELEAQAQEVIARATVLRVRVEQALAAAAGELDGERKRRTAERRYQEQGPA